jgi:hypothetical protein
MAAGQRGISSRGDHPAEAFKASREAVFLKLRTFLQEVAGTYVARHLCRS